MRFQLFVFDTEDEFLIPAFFLWLTHMWVACSCFAFVGRFDWFSRKVSCLEAVWILVLTADFVVKAQNGIWRDPLLPAVCCPVSSENLLKVSNKFLKTGRTSLPCLLGVAWGEIRSHRCRRGWKKHADPVCLSATNPKTDLLLFWWKEETISTTAVHRLKFVPWLQGENSQEENFSGAGLFVLSRQAEERSCRAILSLETTGGNVRFWFCVQYLSTIAKRCHIFPGQTAL